MPIISAEPIEKNIYRVTFTTGYGEMTNVVVSSDGLYNLYFIKDGGCKNATGKILNIVQNRACPKNSYLLFDYSEDNSNKRERIQFFRIQSIQDITPNDAYHIALEHGFVGTVEDWLESLKGEAGKSAYELAVDAGFIGTEEAWLDSSKGKSAYQIALEHGFLGTEDQWLESLNGKSAYALAVANGYVGTETQWLASLNGMPGASAYDIAVKNGYGGTEDEWLKSLNGKSAYQIALEYGFEGSEEEWIKQCDHTELKRRVDHLENVQLVWSDKMT